MACSSMFYHETISWYDNGRLLPSPSRGRYHSESSALESPQGQILLQRLTTKLSDLSAQDFSKTRNLVIGLPDSAQPIHSTTNSLLFSAANRTTTIGPLQE